MKKTIEETWRDGFLDPEALVAPKNNDLYTQKSQHLAEKIQRMLKVNEIAILIGAPVVWLFLSVTGIPYTGAILCFIFAGLLLVGRFYVSKFEAPDNSLDSYHYIKAFDSWLKVRMARSKSVQRHVYAVCFVALAIGMLASDPGQLLIGGIVEGNPDVLAVGGIPVILIAGVVVIALVVELLGGKIFDLDVNTVYRNVFRKLDEMVAEMEELRA